MAAGKEEVIARQMPGVQANLHQDLAGLTREIAGTGKAARVDQAVDPHLSGSSVLRKCMHFENTILVKILASIQKIN